MGFSKPYRFYLKDGANYLYVDNAGVVQSQAGAIEINYAPESWRDVAITFERGWTYYGLFRLYSTPFKFVKDAATIVRWGYYLSLGIEKNITLVIEKFNSTIAVYDYEAFLECELDNSTFVDSFDKVSIELIEGGFLSKLKARENTTYEIDVADNPDAIWIGHDGIKLDCVINWGILPQSFPQAFTALILPVTFYTYTEGTNVSVQAWSVDPPTFQNFFLKNTSASSISFDLKTLLNIDVIMDPGNTVDGTVYVRYDILQLSPLAFVSHNVIHTQGGLTPGTTTTINLDQIDTITLAANQGFEFNILVDDGAGGGGTNNYQIDILDYCKISATFFNRYQTTYFPALRPMKVFESLVSEISDGTTTAVSTLLDTTNETKVITSGDAIRNLESSKMKMAFGPDFWKGVNGVLSAALYYDRASDTVGLEDKASVFDAGTQIQVLGDINNFKCKPLTGEMFAKLKAGFGEFTYDEINGKDEYNQQTEFLLPLVKTTAEKDITSPIRADKYGIEYVRINLTEKLTTDADTDNDNFWIHIEDTPAGTIPDGLPGAGQQYYNLYRQTLDPTPGASYWDIANILHPDTAYNIFFSAKRQLDRWAPYLSAITYLLDALYIKFQQSTKNNPGGLKMRTGEGATPIVIDEAANELVSNYAPPMFLPYLFEISFPDSATLFSALAANPHGYLPFTYKGNQLEGFVIDITTKPKLQTQTCTLLATANCDLSKIVYP